MEFSEEWKSIFPIGRVFESPLLISENPKTLGPLFFNPKPQTTTLLFDSPSLSPPLLNPPPSVSFRTFLSVPTRHDPAVPAHTTSSVASLFGPHCQNFLSPSLLLSHNRLQFLKCPLGDSVLVFFPSGPNTDQVGFLLLSVKKKALVATGKEEGSVFTAGDSGDRQILRILVQPVEYSAGFEGKDNVFGYLLVCTMYSVHWFCVKMSEVRKKMPVLACRGRKVFKTGLIVAACWSPHLPEESVVLLEDGSLFLFDLEGCSDEFKGIREKELNVRWDDPGGNSMECKWLGCEFSWHPRILVVARSDAVFIVDWRCGAYNVACLAKIDMFGAYASVKKERFLAFSKAASGHFHFVLASDSMLALCDVRKPLAPLLQWAHGHNKPRYIDVFRLSQLRSNSREITHEWATASGFAIILGSFWHCEFSFFCYGPPAPPREGSFTSEISQISKPMYAWQLPSDFLLSGHECKCGDCLVREEFGKDALPEWVDWQHKKDMVLGFGFLSSDLSTLLFEPDDGGFTLIRLMSSGKLESQRYSASWGLSKNLDIVHRDPLLSFQDNLLNIRSDEKYKFARKFIYFKFDHLHGYLNDNLSQVLDSSIAKPYEGSQNMESLNLEIHEVLCEKLMVCGFGRFRTSPAISVVLDDIDSPSSVCEVASRRIWADLPKEILQLAFSSYSDTSFNDCLSKKKSFPGCQKLALEFWPVPDQPQLPPFFLRKPSNNTNRRSRRFPHADNILVGPLLPLPILSTLHHLRNGSSNSQDDEGGFSPEVELKNRCLEVMEVAKEMAVPNSPKHIDNHAVSRADDRDIAQVDAKKKKSLFLYHPPAFRCSTDVHIQDNSVFMGGEIVSLIANVHEKQPTCSDKSGSASQAVFDGTCPIGLKFDAGSIDFDEEELQAFKFLKRDLLKWKEGFAPSKEFLRKFPV